MAEKKKWIPVAAVAGAAGLIATIILVTKKAKVAQYPVDTLAPTDTVAGVTVEDAQELSSAEKATLIAEDIRLKGFPVEEYLEARKQGEAAARALGTTLAEQAALIIELNKRLQEEFGIYVTPTSGMTRAEYLSSVYSEVSYETAQKQLVASLEGGWTAIKDEALARGIVMTEEEAKAIAIESNLPAGETLEDALADLATVYLATNTPTEVIEEALVAEVVGPTVEAETTPEGGVTVTYTDPATGGPAQTTYTPPAQYAAAAAASGLSTTSAAATTSASIAAAIDAAGGNSAAYVYYISIYSGYRF